jgi:hypothetical protein
MYYIYSIKLGHVESAPGADPGFCSGGGGVQGVQVNRGGGGATLRIKEKHFKIWRQSCSEGGVRTPCTLPLDPPLSSSVHISGYVGIMVRAEIKFIKTT